MDDVMQDIEALELEVREALRAPGGTDYFRTRVHEFAMKVARASEVYYRHSLHGYDRQTCEREAMKRYPLPPKRVLREEPVPGAGHPGILFRWVDGELQRRGPLSGGWEPRVTVDGNRTDLMRHAIDLSERPYREEPQ